MNTKTLLFQVIELSPFPQVLVNPDYPKFTIAYANKKLLDYLNISLEEATGESVINYAHHIYDEAHASIIISGLKRVIDDKETNYSPISINSKATVKNQPLFNDKGDVEFILRTAGEIAVRNNTKYRSFFQEASDAIIITDSKGKVKEVNEKACKIFEYEQEELLKLHARDLVDKDELKERPLQLDILHEKRSVKHERIALHKDGSKFHIDLSATALHNGDVLTTIRDISEKKAQAKALKESERQLTAMFNNEPNAVKLVSKDLKLLNINSSGLKLFEANNMEEVLGVELLSLVSPEYHKQYSKTYLAALRGKPGKVIYQIKDLKGGIKWVESQAVPFNDYKGHKSCIMSIARDITIEKEASDALEISRERLELVTNATNDAVWEWDKVTNEFLGNAGLYKLYGYKNEIGDISSKAFFTRVHPDDQEAIGKRLQNALERGTNQFIGEYRFRVKSGEYRQFFERVLIAYNAKGDAIRVLGAMQDITERKKAREALIRSDQKYRYLFNSNPLPMFIYNFESLKITDCNIAACRKYGYSRKQFLELTLKDIRPPSEVEKVVTAMSFSAKTGDYRQGVWIHQNKKGQLMHMEVTTHIIDHEGELSALVLANDITERLKASEELIKSNERLKSSNRIAQLGYWEIDLNSSKISWSEELYNITKIGKNKKEITFQDSFDIGHPDDVELTQLMLKQCIEQQQDEQFSFRLVWPNNEIRHVNIVIRVAEVKNGVVTALEGTLQDVTERTKYIKLLEAQNKRLRKIAWIQSHVVRAPLAKIIGLANLIETNSLSEAEMRKTLYHLIEASDELDEVIREITTLAEKVRFNFDE